MPAKLNPKNPKYYFNGGYPVDDFIDALRNLPDPLAKQMIDQILLEAPMVLARLIEMNIEEIRSTDELKKRVVNFLQFS